MVKDCLSTFDTVFGQIKQRYGDPDRPLRSELERYTELHVREATFTRGAGQIVPMAMASEKLCLVSVRYSKLPAEAEGRKSSGRF
jgi:hypothetical protein